MSKLDITLRMQAASTAVGVLKVLELTDKTMTYGDFARVIGLIPNDGAWQACHRNHVSDILNLVSAAERQNGEEAKLPYHRIVNAQTGESGSGLPHEHKVVRVA